MSKENEEFKKLDALYKAIENQEIVDVDNNIVRVRHWKIEKKLGEGSTAQVFLGRSLIDETMVAIKVFKQEYFENQKNCEANQKMMRTEAALVGKIFHPNILQTYSVGINSSPKYMVMEFVYMGSLEEYVNPPKAFNLIKLIRIFFQCACALQYSDEICVIHRDIKPANILLSQGGIPKITDFGSSMVKGMDKDAVKGVGSPCYMSAEQLRQDPLNQQTDIYSLGATFYEMLTGQKTLEAKTQKDLIHKILYVEPPAISKYISSQLPDGLEEIIKQCLKKDRNLRYLNWMDLLVDIVQMNYKIIPKDEYFKIIDEISAFDWVRKCAVMEIFEDSELWDLIQSGAVYRVSCGMAFTIAKIIDPDANKPSIKNVDKNVLDSTDLLNDEKKSFIEPTKTQLVHTFVLGGAIQSYGVGSDKRIQILRVGDYCANIEIIEDYTKMHKAQAFSIDDTVLLSVEESAIRFIHPTVREKLDTLILKSQQNHLAILKERHTKINVHQAVKEASMNLHLI